MPEVRKQTINYKYSECILTTYLTQNGITLDFVPVCYLSWRSVDIFLLCNDRLDGNETIVQRAKEIQNATKGQNSHEFY